MKLGFKELGITPKCHRCGEAINSINDLGVDNYDISINKHLHVCDPKNIDREKITLKEVIKDAQKQQAELQKSKQLNYDLLRKPMDI